MNQAIIFNDDIHWCKDRQSIVLTAQYSGCLITCVLSSDYLTKFVSLGTVIESLLPQQLVKLTSDNQFDVEEDAQIALEDERLSDNNELLLTLLD
ncbi:DUF1488 family protein [Psychrobium sp. 1_MG-2023]|uniref:DUF1488 family protein n=1 Tax=Psychrobium sp. 1_MG-2023 TaxID=3062624 RepID=UPI000C320213|nr:DUF1488 family protein [Psychrobium sp. 1_MG-2023]MDP2560984.1 DUF1488 family protein [Psychrobium sp. 1_MG-2023]PKF58278.1 hypothetical protein CW748_03710 [Alteromonadales bacterium alter-6D02]